MLDVVSSENREKTLRFVLTSHGHATDKLPTGYRHITNSRPTVGRLSVHCRPTGSLYFGQNLSAVCRPTVGRQTADSRPTVGRQTTNCRPTVGRQLTDSRPTGFLGSSSSQLPRVLLYHKHTLLPESMHANRVIRPSFNLLYRGAQLTFNQLFLSSRC